MRKNFLQWKSTEREATLLRGDYPFQYENECIVFEGCEDQPIWITPDSYTAYEMDTSYGMADNDNLESFLPELYQFYLKKGLNDG